jgi:hypothetical protein
MTVKAGKRISVLKPALYPILLVVLFYLVIAIGVAAGKWHSQIPYEEYQRLIPQVSQFTHP